MIVNDIYDSKGIPCILGSRPAVWCCAKALPIGYGGFGGFAAYHALCLSVTDDDEEWTLDEETLSPYMENR